MSPETRAWYAIGPFALAPALVVGLVLGFTVGAVAGLVAGAVLVLALAAWAWLAADSRVVALAGGRAADPVDNARFCNLVEGLSTTAGVRQPRLRVVDSPGLNLLVAGTRPSRGVIIATTGLLAELNRIELEAVLAEALAQLRHRDTVPGTVLVATFGLERRRVLASDMDAQSDQRAVSITRYPPALASALEKMESKGTEVSGPSYLAHLWLADPTGSSSRAWGRLPLRDRIEALREL